LVHKLQPDMNLISEVVHRSLPLALDFRADRSALALRLHLRGSRFLKTEPSCVPGLLVVAAQRTVRRYASLELGTAESPFDAERDVQICDSDPCQRCAFDAQARHNGGSNPSARVVLCQINHQA